jgi:hypothetical protein
VAPACEVDNPVTIRHPVQISELQRLARMTLCPCLCHAEFQIGRKLWMEDAGRVGQPVRSRSLFLGSSLGVTLSWSQDASVASNQCSLSVRPGSGISVWPGAGMPVWLAVSTARSRDVGVTRGLGRGPTTADFEPQPHTYPPSYFSAARPGLWESRLLHYIYQKYYSIP